MNAAAMANEAGSLSAICTTMGRQAIWGWTRPPASRTRSAVRTASPGWRLLAMIAAHDTGRPMRFATAAASSTWKSGPQVASK